MLFERRKGIIRNALALNPEYIPDNLPGREREIKEIARTLAYLEDAGISQNTFVIGPPGTGKTAVTKYILREFEKYSIDSFTAYVNCWIYRTKFAVLTELAEKLGIPVPRRGVAIDEVSSRIFKGLERKKNAVIILDEIDKLASDDLLYELSRLTSFVEIPVAIITIANTNSFINRLDPRIISSLFRNKIEFEPYRVPELKEIVSERAELSLFPGTYTDGVISLCAVEGWKRGGDARVSISMLFESAKLAEEEGERKITEKYVKIAAKRFKIDVNCANPKHRKIIEILRERGKMRVRSLWEEYTKSAGKITLRAFRNYIKDLENSGIIRIERAKVRGNVRYVELADT